MTDDERVDYQSWLDETLTNETVDYLELKATKKYKFIKPIAVGLVKMNKILHAEINPFAIKREKQKVEAEHARLDEEASRIKRLREDKVEQDDTRQRIREAQRIAH